MKHKAVGLLSGGLDSALACKLIVDQGFEVHVVYIDMPWGCGKSSRMRRIAEGFGLTFKIIPIGDDYLKILRKPKHGFGTALNPCADCHAYMVRKAADHMREIGAAFMFTGEVLGQRPMSQRKECLKWVEEEGGIPGQLLRPLSAQLMEPTIPEQQGIVDRAQLLAISGRSRKTQIELAKKYGLEHYSQPGGGCLLTEKLYGARVKDVLKRGCENIQETAILGMGRYFRLSDKAYAVVARDNAENEKLIQQALDADLILRSTAFPGPAAVLRSKEPSIDEIRSTAGLIQYFSKFRGGDPQPVDHWRKSEKSSVTTVMAAILDESTVKQIWM